MTSNKNTTINGTPREWVSDKHKCLKCDSNLHMYEWGDWGKCPKCVPVMLWNMFQKKGL